LKQKQEQKQSLKEELADVKDRLAGLEAQELYLTKVGELIDTRKKIDIGIKKEASLRETAELLEETEQKLSELMEQEHTTGENIGRNGDISRDSSYGDLGQGSTAVPGRSGVPFLVWQPHCFVLPFH
jgi:hypothetical protein